MYIVHEFRIEEKGKGWFFLTRQGASSDKQKRGMHVVVLQFFKSSNERCIKWLCTTLQKYGIVP